MPVDRFGFHELIAKAREAARAGDLDRALELVTSTVVDIGTRGPAQARIFTSAELDALTLELGKMPASPRQSPQSGVVIMATALASVGGHTRIIKDLIAADPETSFVLLVSNVFHNQDRSALARLMPPNVRLRLAPKAGLALTTRWLQRQLAELAPLRTYIFNHPYDATIVAASQPELTGRLYFYHHADHALCLGAHIPHALHVDFNAKGYFNCRERESVKGNVVWPLSSAQSKPVWRPRSDWHERGLTTACIGTANKFESNHLRQPIPYAITYDEMVITVLRATDGRHLHVGHLSTEMLDRIRERLSQAGMPGAFFVHQPFAPSVAGVLEDHEVDLYLGSFPQGGGLTLVEAMAAGMPLLLHSNYRSIFFCDIHEAYPRVRSWRTLSELAHALETSTPGLLKEESERARAFFDRHHTFNIFATAVKDTLNGAPQAPPENPAHILDVLQNYLDEQAAHDAGHPLADPPRARDVFSDLSRLQRARATPAPLSISSSGTEIASGFEVLSNVERVVQGAGYMEITGWVFGTPDITSIVVLYDGQMVAATRPNLERPDVLQAFPGRASVTPGFSSMWQLADEQPPPHRLTLKFYADSEQAAISSLVIQSIASAPRQNESHTVDWG